MHKNELIVQVEQRRTEKMIMDQFPDKINEQRFKNK